MLVISPQEYVSRRSNIHESALTLIQPPSGVTMLWNDGRGKNICLYKWCGVHIYIYIYIYIYVYLSYRPGLEAKRTNVVNQCVNGDEQRDV